MTKERLIGYGVNFKKGWFIETNKKVYYEKNYINFEKLKKKFKVKI